MAQVLEHLPSKSPEFQPQYQQKKKKEFKGRDVVKGH
jgi:hypothetical protein